MGEGDLPGVVGVGEGGGDLGEEVGVEHVLGSPDEVQADSASSPDNRFLILTPATLSISRFLARSNTTLALKGMLPETKPSWMVCTVMEIFPSTRIL